MTHTTPPSHLAALQQALVQLQADGINVEAHNAPHDGCLYIIIPGVKLVDGRLEEER